MELKVNKQLYLMAILVIFLFKLNKTNATPFEYASMPLLYFQLSSLR